MLSVLWSAWATGVKLWAICEVVTLGAWHWAAHGWIHPTLCAVAAVFCAGWLLWLPFVPVDRPAWRDRCPWRDPAMGVALNAKGIHPCEWIPSGELPGVKSPGAR